LVYQGAFTKLTEKEPISLLLISEPIQFLLEIGVLEEAEDQEEDFSKNHEPSDGADGVNHRSHSGL
jgi:hypothetical protein